MITSRQAGRLSYWYRPPLGNSGDGEEQQLEEPNSMGSEVNKAAGTTRNDRDNGKEGKDKEGEERKEGVAGDHEGSRDQSTPIIFAHGIGVGLVPYRAPIAELTKGATKRKVNGSSEFSHTTHTSTFSHHTSIFSHPHIHIFTLTPTLPLPLPLSPTPTLLVSAGGHVPPRTPSHLHHARKRGRPPPGK